MIGVALILSLAVAACAGDDDATTTAENGDAGQSLSQDTLKVAIYDAPNNAMLLRTALARGYFEDEGLSLEILNIGTGAEQLAGLTGGSLDMTQSGPSTTMIPMEKGEIDVKLVGTAAVGSDWQLAIDPDFAESRGFDADTDPEEIIPELAGAKFGGVVGPTDSIATVLSYVLSQYGVDPAGETTTEYLGSTPAMLASLEAGRIDAFLSPSDQTSFAKDRVGAVIVSLQDLEKVPNITDGVANFFTVTSSFAEEHPDTLDAFMKAYWSAWDYLKDEGNQEEVHDLMKEAYPDMSEAVFDATFDIGYQVYSRNGAYVSEGAFDSTLDLVNSTQEAPLETVSYSASFDSSFQDAAIADLGITPPNA
ncbi:MAG TPA: ABC transporter substrate-binding protein [Acidimicrobiales bacterium]|nr:ABC transporter substrate-binding protein [Acidimicrobiales bacterium]